MLNDHLINKKSTIFIFILTSMFSILILGCVPGKDRTPSGLGQKEREIVQKQLLDLQNSVEVISFIENDCSTCPQALAFYDEIAIIQNKVTHKSVSLDKNAEDARAYNISRAPAVVIQKGKDLGIRFYGIPSGHEFSTFIETIKRVSEHNPNVSATGVAALLALKVPINIKIFVTPT